MEDNIKNLGKVCITPEGVWDVNKEYDRLSLVVTTDAATQKALSYVSRQHVPAGNISINNTEYWQLFTTELKFEDIIIDENGNVKIGDVVIYQIPLGDALGEIVVDKIKADLTNYIMTEIRSYMNGMVTELINSFSNQIGRLIDNGFEIRNKLSGEVNAKHSGTINVNVNGSSEGGESEEHEFIFTGDNLNASIDANGGYVQKYVTSTKDGSNIGLNTSNWPNWITEVSTSEVGTQYRINIRFAENTSEDTRTGTITLTQNESGNTLLINVTQTGSNVTPTDEFVFTSNKLGVINKSIAGNKTVGLTSTKNGELIGFETTNKPEWVTISSYEYGTRHEVILTFPANTSESDRTGTVTFTQNESGNTVTITVIQYGTDYTVDVTVINGNTQEEIPTAHIEINDVSAQSRSFSEGTNVLVKVTADGYIARDITERPITQQDPLIQSDYEYSQTINNLDQDTYITVELYPEPDTYVFTANTEAEPNKTLNYDADVQIFDTALTSTKNGSQIGYTVSSQPNWVTAINTQQNGNISGNMTANDSTESRSGDIVLTQNESGNTLTITIVQAGASSSEDSDVYVFEATPDTISLGAGTNLTANIAVVSTKNGSFHSYMRNSESNWFTATVSGNTVTIVAQENTTNTSRTHRLILTQSDSNNILYVDITQAAATYRFAATRPDGNGNNIEVDLSIGNIALTQSLNYAVLAPILYINNVLSDKTVTVTKFSFTANAANTNKFNVVNNATNATVALKDPTDIIAGSTTIDMTLTCEDVSRDYVLTVNYTV